MNTQVKVAIIGAVGVVAAASITASFRLPSSPQPQPSNTVSTAPSSVPTVATDPPSPTFAMSPSANASPSGAGGLIAEWTDNRRGTQVFRDPQGDAVSANQLIPFDTKVLVKCWVDNQSDMGSVNAFYLIETAPWIGDYAPADTFANGDPIGGPGSTAIDPAVPHC